MFEASLLFADQSKSESENNTFSPSRLLRLVRYKIVVPYLLAFSGLLWSSWGLWLLLSGENALPLNDSTQVASESSIVVTADENQTINQLLVVDVSGAVNSPGIYRLAPDSRVADALESAGGVSELADLEYVQSTLNLASLLADEQKIYLPFVTEQTMASGLETKESNSKEDGLVSINFAQQSELVTLPKIGTVTAKKIVAGRPYQSVNELIENHIIGQSVWEEIQELIKL